MQLVPATCRVEHPVAEGELDLRGDDKKGT